MVNLKHLHYFWKVARSGGVVRAGEQLNVSPQTISELIHTLEDRLGVRLLERRGRGVQVTEAGELALEYADRIFALGAECEQALREGGHRSLRLRVGVSDAVPKSIAYHLLEPATRLPGLVHIVCREWKLDRLIAELAAHRLDLVIADGPMPQSSHVRAYNHRLGHSTLAFFAAPALALQLGDDFPRNLDRAPILLPGTDSEVSPHLLAWFERQDVSPRAVGEFDDGALMMAFGRAGSGVFAAPAVLADEICEQYGVQVIGRTGEIRQEYFAISIERRITHPCVLAVSHAASDMLER